MIRRPPISTRTDTLIPYTSLFRSRSAAYRTEDIVATIAREKGIDLMLAAEVFMHRCDRLHVEWRVRPRMVRRHGATRSEEHPSELQSIIRIQYADFCL